MELSPGAVIANKLRLLRPLGEGGMGVVWAARHLALDADVAVKFVRPERANPALLARFEREARATARISHPNVVKVMDFGAVDEAVPYIVMELVLGAPLAELLARGGRLSIESMAALVHQVGGALASAHAKGVIHRDIKPHNVFITEGARGVPLFVKVLDFGIAKMLGDDQDPGGSGVLTQTGSVVGSPPYMSPEQLEGREDTDLRSDLWSFGVVVYEALTGAQPFRGSSFVAVGAAVLRGRYELATSRRPNLPAAIDDWFAKALSLDPAGRFQSADEMVEAFDRVATEMREGPPSSDGSAREVFDVGDVAHATTVDASAPVIAREEPDPAPRVSNEPVEVEASQTQAPAPRALAPILPSIVTKPSRRRMRFGAGLLVIGALALGVGFAARPHDARCPSGMVRIDGANFAMGSDVDGETPSDETPKKTTNVATFCLDATEVTVAAYAACPTCERPRSADFEGLTPNGRTFENQFCNGPDAADHPMNCVDWSQAKIFCASVDKRLPTEQEWELAARGKEGRTYPWGDAPPDGAHLNACGAECSKMLTERLEKAGKGAWPSMYADDDHAAATSPVGRYRAGATPAGVFDLAGNVWEWTESAYCPYRDPECGDSRRVLKGGGWDTTERQNVRAARRYPSAPTARGKSVGFRCAKNS